MAKKIDKATAERAAALGIKKVKDEGELREKLLNILAENDIDGMEEEDTDSLFDMVESMVGGDEPEELDEESEADELSEEVEDDEEEEIEDEEEDEAEEEEKKPAPKSEKKPAKKIEKSEKRVSKRGVKLDPKQNKDDRKAFKFLEKFFSTDKYEYCWIVMNGLTIKFKGSNSSRAVLSLEACSKKESGETSCNAFLLTFTKSLEVLDEAGIDYKICWNGVPFVKDVSFEELTEIIETLFPEVEKFVEKIDKRLGDNRKKMEESLNKTTKKEKTTKKYAPKKSDKVEEPDEDEVEDEVEDEEPAPKKAAKKPVKKSKK